MRQRNKEIIIINKPDPVCLRCTAYYRNNDIYCDDINDVIEISDKFRGRYCKGKKDLSGCDLGPYEDVVKIEILPKAAILDIN